MSGGPTDGIHSRSTKGACAKTSGTSLNGLTGFPGISFIISASLNYILLSCETDGVSYSFGKKVNDLFLDPGLPETARSRGPPRGEQAAPGLLESPAYRSRRIPLEDCYSVVGLANTHCHGSPSSTCTAAKKNKRRPTRGPGSSFLAKKCRALKYLDRIGCIPAGAWQLPPAVDCDHCCARRIFREPPGFCCSSGKIFLERTKMPLDLWHLYTDASSHIGEHFQQRCRTYNNSSAFTSLGIYYDHELCKGDKGVYTFKVQGGIYHFIRDLIPAEGCGRQLQLYFYGTENEVANRLAQSGDLDGEVVSLIMGFMKNNPYANFFRSLRDMPDLNSYKIVLRADPSLDSRVYNLPVVDHVAAIWNELTDVPSERPHDVRVYTKSGSTQFIHYYYGCYDPLQYPLLFPYGEPGWHTGIHKEWSDHHALDADSNPLDDDLPLPLLDDQISCENLLSAEHENLERNRDNHRNVAAREFYCYRFQLRRDDVTNILRAGRLIQQYQIDMYVKIETQRLDYLRKAQSQQELRSESFQGIVDSMACDGVTYGRSIGQRIVLPASFLGGPRDLRRRYMNALALVTTFGKPDFFLTMTCNPNWPEVQSELLTGEHAHNRADLLVRIFRAKNEELKNEIMDKEIFGKVAAYLYVIEFQKRGLPHVHWLVILKKKYKITSVDAYDRFVSAEIPDPDVYPHLHSCVCKHMIHGPCGNLNANNICMRAGSCKNHYRHMIKYTTEADGPLEPPLMRTSASPGHDPEADQLLLSCLIQSDRIQRLSTKMSYEQTKTPKHTQCMTDGIDSTGAVRTKGKQIKNRSMRCVVLEDDISESDLDVGTDTPLEETPADGAAGHNPTMKRSKRGRVIRPKKIE